jgi:hypothetical protein
MRFILDEKAKNLHNDVAGFFRKKPASIKKRVLFCGVD